MCSVKTHIPPGVHITKGMHVCRHTGIHIDILYIFPWTYISFYGVAPQTRALLKWMMRSSLHSTVRKDLRAAVEV